MFQFLFLIFLVGIVQCNPHLPVTPCRHNDFGCMILSYNRNFHQNVIPNYGLEPLQVNTFTVTSPKLTYTYVTPKMFGLERCVISELRVDFSKGIFNSTLACPELLITGDYRASGLVLDALRVDGMGKFYLIIYTSAVSFTANLKLYTGPDHEERMYLRLKNRTYLPTGAAIPNYENLVDGDKMASHEAQLFFEKNSQALMEAYAATIFDPFFTAWLEKMNKFHSDVPLKYVFSEPNH